MAVIGAQKYELFSFERAGHTIGFEAVGMNTIVCVDGGGGQAFSHHLHLWTVPCGSQYVNCPILEMSRIFLGSAAFRKSEQLA